MEIGEWKEKILTCDHVIGQDHMSSHDNTQRGSKSSYLGLIIYIKDKGLQVLFLTYEYCQNILFC